jgi:murein DD-endopeptidase MepM/ murein hydrolase activator NlpD
VPSNLGSYIFYPDNPEDRFFKLPFDSGLVCSIYAGPWNRNGLHHGHYQWDFPRPWGYPVLAARAGAVVGINDTAIHLRNFDFDSSGIVVTFQEYMHVNGDTVIVEMGQNVEQGELIAYVGQVGMWDHLHYEVTQTMHTGYSRHPTATIPIPFVEVIDQPPGIPYKPDGIPWGLNSYVSQNVRYNGQAKVKIEPPGSSGPEITAYPNPFSTSVNIHVLMRSAECGMMNMGIYDISGRLVYTFSTGGVHTNSAKYVRTPPLQYQFRIPHSAFGNSYVWNASDHPAGLYIVNVRYGDELLRKKILLR